MRLHRAALGLVAVLGVAVALAHPAAADKIMVTNYARVTNTLNWVIAFKKNFFKDEGLEVDEIVRGDGGGTSLRKMLAGDLPYGEVTITSALAAIRQGIPLVIVNAANNHPAEISLVMAPGQDIKTIKDLAGKKVGYSNPKSMTEIFFRIILHRHDVLDKVDLVALGSLGPIITALENRAVAAGPMQDPFLTLQPDKFRLIFRIADHVPRVTWAVGVTTREFAAKQPEKLRAFIRVHRRSVEYLYENQKEAADIYAEVYQRPRDEVEKILPKYFKDMPGLWSKGDFDKEGLAVMNEGLKLIGDIDKPIDWNSVIDQRFLPEDLQRKL